MLYLDGLAVLAGVLDPLGLNQAAFGPPLQLDGLHVPGAGQLEQLTTNDGIGLVEGIIQLSREHRAEPLDTNTLPIWPPDGLGNAGMRGVESSRGEHRVADFLGGGHSGNESGPWAGKPAAAMARST